MKRRLKDNDWTATYRAGPNSLNHLERQAIIQAPFPVTRRIPGKSWGGCYIRSSPIPECGRRGGVRSDPHDEELVRSWFPDVGAVWRDRSTGATIEDALWETIGRPGAA